MNSTTIWVSGRYLTRKVTGVERVANEVLKSLSDNFLDDHGQYEQDGCTLKFKLAIEKDTQIDLPVYASHWDIGRFGDFKGHAWEQIDLARLPPDDWVLSLCNTGPMLRRNQAIFFHDAQVYAIPENFDWKFRWWYKALLSIAGRRSRVLFTNSFFSQSELSKHTGISAKKFNTIHLGCDHMERIAPEKPSALLAKLKGQPYVLAVSSASPNKNFASVLKALELMGPDAPHCVIVGQQYSKIFKETRLDHDRVIEMGYVSDEALAGLYEHAMCLVYPSFYEGFGLPPLEAMLLGCPVIASNRSSLPEVCGDAALYCEPDQPETIASAILGLMKDPEKVASLRSSSKKHAQAYTWKKCAEQTLQALFKEAKKSQSSVN